MSNIKWNNKQNTKLFIHKNVFENVVCQNGGHCGLSRGDDLILPAIVQGSSCISSQNVYIALNISTGHMLAL